MAARILFGLFAVLFISQAQGGMVNADGPSDTDWTYDVQKSSKVIVGSDVYGIILWKDRTTVTIDLTSDTKGASKDTIKQFRKAIKMWNKCMQGRVTVKEVKGGGNYFARYREQCGSSSTAVASATLPHGYDGDGDGTICFTNVLNARTPQLKLNTFLHEVGHMMGLRHTHDYRENGSYEPEPDRYLYFKYNKKSIMSYTSYAPDRHLTKGDCAGTRKLYQEARKAKCLNVKSQENRKVCRPFKTIRP